MDEEAVKIYPTIPTCPKYIEPDIIQDNPHQFRLSEISRIRDALERDVEKRCRTRRRHKTAHRASSVITITAGTFGTLCTSGSVATLAIGVTAPVGLILGAVALASGAISAVSSFCMKKCSKKVEKHTVLAVQAEKSLDRLSGVVSKALRDGRLSADEFEAVLAEKEQYHAAVSKVYLKASKAPIKNEELIQALRQLKV